MKYLCNILILIIISGSMFGQGKLERKLSDVYPPQKVESILKDSQKKAYYQKVLFNSYVLKTYHGSKLKHSPYPILKTITITNKLTKNKKIVNATQIIDLIENENFNILLTDIKRDFSKTLYFQLANTNKVLIIYSYKKISTQ